MVTSLEIQTFLIAKGIRSIAAWCRRARVKPSVAYQCRTGRSIPKASLEKLARIVGESPDAVRSLLSPRGRDA